MSVLSDIFKEIKPMILQWYKKRKAKKCFAHTQCQVQHHIQGHGTTTLVLQIQNNNPAPIIIQQIVIKSNNGTMYRHHTAKSIAYGGNQQVFMDTMGLKFILPLMNPQQYTFANQAIKLLPAEQKIIVIFIADSVSKGNVIAVDHETNLLFPLIHFT